MATITTSRRAYKDGLLTTDCECIRIELGDGSILRFTNSFNDLTISSERVGTSNVLLGSPVTYQAIVSPPKLSAIGFGDAEAGSMDIEGIFDPSVFTRDSIASGKFNRARVTVFLTNYQAPIENDEILFSGFWGETTAIDGRYLIKFSSLLDALNVDVGRVYSAMCDEVLGGNRCGVDLTIAPLWQASTSYIGDNDGDTRKRDQVRHTTDPNNIFYWRRALTKGTSSASEPAFQDNQGDVIVDNDITWETFRAYKIEGLQISTELFDTLTLVTPFPKAEFEDYYIGGSIEITSGKNLGSIRRVIDNSQTDITLSSELEFATAVGDTFDLVVGCQKRLAEDCDSKFRNYKNYQGFPYMPGLINIRSTGEI